MTVRVILLSAAVATASLSPGWAASCAGELGLSDPAAKSAFCAELDALLLEPYDGTAGERSGDDLPPEVARILEDFPEFFEAYRSHPQKTLDLIERIRDLGGLAK